MERYRHNTIRDKFIHSGRYDLSQELAELFCEGKLTTILQFVDGLLDAAVVAPGSMNNREVWRPLQTTTAEMA
jgi:hypothetical protein